MSENLSKSGFTIPKDGDPKNTWGDANITGDLDQTNGVGLLPAIDEIIGEMYETPADILTSDLKLNAKLSTGAAGGGEVQILNDTQNIVKSIKSDTITFTDGGDTVTAEITQGLPVIASGDVGKKVIVNDAEDGYTLVASSTTAGFNDKSAQTLSFNNATRTISITPVGDDYKITYDNGKVKSFTSADSIQIANTNGIHGVYYDNTTAALKTFASETRSEIYDNILNDIAVGYIEWSVTDQEHNIVTEILKDRTMSNKTFVKNFFDKSIYVLEGMTTFSDPSQGGTVTPNASLDASAQVGFTAGVSLFGDGKYTIPARAVDFNWSVYYINPLGELRHTVKTDYLFLQDTDLGGASNRVLYNNNGVPTPASSGNYVWYGIGVINATEDQHKVVSFMGENAFGILSIARANVDKEKVTIENSIKIKQEMTIVYMVLLETKSSFGNATECRIVDLQVTTTESGSISAGGSVVPADLVNGADATYLHMHDSVYRKLTNNTFTADVDMGGYDIKSASVVNASSVVGGSASLVRNGSYTLICKQESTTQAFPIGAFNFTAISKYGEEKQILSHRQDANQVVINEGGTDTTFRVESSSNDNAFKVDGVTGDISVGENLNVSGVVNASSVVTTSANKEVVAEYADNAAAISAGLAVGTHYRTGDLLKIVH